MAFRALLEADLGQMARSWAVRIWVVLMVAQALITLPIASNEGTAAEGLAGVLGTFPLLWSTFIIIISSGAVSSEAGVVADSILSKAVTRYEYILAKMTSRLITVVVLYLLIALLSAYLLSRYATDDLNRTGVTWGILTIGMQLVLLTSLAVTFSTLFNRTSVALMVTWFLWFGAGAIFALFKLENISPLHIVDRLSETLQGTYSTGDQWQALLAFGVAASGAISLAVLHFAHKDL
jgi:ABC-2 type transport system permease protein